MSSSKFKSRIFAPNPATTDCLKLKIVDQIILEWHSQCVPGAEVLHTFVTKDTFSISIFTLNWVDKLLNNYILQIIMLHKERQK